MRENLMKIVGISDLHGYLEDPTEMPPGDVLCICGDIAPLDYQNDYEQCIAWFCLEFVPWTDSLPYKKVIFIGGNHDFFLEKLHLKSHEYTLDEDGYKSMTYRWRSPSDVLRKLLPGNNKGKHKLVYLCDNSYEYNGVLFYGSPWIADLSRWAFYKQNEDLKLVYNKIPKKCDVLLTHMPPKMGGCGEVIQRGCFNTGADFGSELLTNAILERDIKWSLCGHVHSGRHNPLEYKDGCFAVNCSIKNEDYRPQYHPIEFNI